MAHTPVLLREAVEALNLSEGKVLLDGTLGGGGHSAFALEQYPGVQLIGLDRDPDAITRSGERLRAFSQQPGQAVFVNESFRNLDKVLGELGVKQVDAILLDIGFSSDQMDSSGRGFSFQKDEPLDMRMSNSGLTAADVLNNWDEETLELILRGFGEERYSRRIAAKIAEIREAKPFRTTFELLEAVRAATPTAYHHQRTNPATKTFQAVRIAVNEELTALEEGLKKGFERLSSGGRFAVISFHSLEDRMVKNFFRERAEAGEAKVITKRPIIAAEAEQQANPRSRSAKLRVLEKI